MGERKRPELLARLRLNKVMAHFAFLLVLTHALVPAGWMPAFASSDGQSFSMIICTAAGMTHVQIGPDGQPVNQAPEQGSTHDHQCCPCVAKAQVAPPANVIVLLLPMNTSRAPVVFAAARHALVVVRSPHSPRAPPSFA